MASAINIPTLRQLVTLGSEAWELVREAFATTKSEIEALQASSGGGLGPKIQPELFKDYLSPETQLLASTSTTTSTRTHTLTLGGTHARTITITFADSIGAYVGPWTITGMRAGVVQTESLSISPDGSESFESFLTYDPGTITVSRPAQNNTSGSYLITVGSGFGLMVEAYESTADLVYAGHLLSLVSGGPLQATIGGQMAIAGPSFSGPTGKLQFAPTVLVTFAGDPFEILYLAAEGA